MTDYARALAEQTAATFTRRALQLARGNLESREYYEAKPGKAQRDVLELIEWLDAMLERSDAEIWK